MTHEEEIKSKTIELERLAAARKKTLKELKLSKKMLRRQERSNSELELDPEKKEKETRKSAFSLKGLVEQLGLEIDHSQAPTTRCRSAGTGRRGRRGVLRARLHMDGGEQEPS